MCNFIQDIDKTTILDFIIGLTILDQIIIEHNLLAVSKLYKNIRIEQLALILNVTPIIAEKNAALMIRNGCLEGSIDQVESLINFRSKVQFI